MTTLLQKINSDKRESLVLSDYIKIKHGFAFKGEYFSDTPTENILVTPGNFAIGGGFKGNKLKYYDGPVPSEYILNERDLVVTMTDLSVDADTLGYSALIPQSENKKFLHNQRVGLVQKIKDGIDFDYLYYLMRTRAYQKYVVSTASGSTVKHTSPDRIAGYVFEFPSLPMQKKIAEILSAYDSKIENNNTIIKNLEQMALTIFDKFIEKSAEGKLVDEAEIVMGQSPESSHYNEAGEGLPFHQGVTYFGERFPENVMYSTAGEKKANEGDILVSVRAPVGRINIATTDMIIGRGLGAVRSRSGHQSYLFYLLKNLFHKEDLFGSGSVFPAINKKEFENLSISISTKKQKDEFERKALPIDEMINERVKENIALKKMRNQLLKKLI